MVSPALMLADDLPPPPTEMSAIAEATLPAQRQCLTTLGEMVHDLKQSGLGSPAIVVVGDVVLGVRAALREVAAVS